MAFDTKQSSEVAKVPQTAAKQQSEFAKAFMAVWEVEKKRFQELEHLIEILVGDIHEKWPATFEEALVQKCGYSKEQVANMTIDDKIEAIKKLSDVINKRPTRMQTLAEWLDTILAERYGWTEGSGKRTGKELTLSEALLALKSAVENPNDPIWEIV